MAEMRIYQIEFILETRSEDESVNTFRKVATDLGIAKVAGYAASLADVDGQKIVSVHRIADHGKITVI